MESGCIVVTDSDSDAQRPGPLVRRGMLTVLALGSVAFTATRSSAVFGPGFRVWWVVLAPVLPGISVVATIRLRWFVRLGVAVATAAAVAAVHVRAVGGRLPADLARAVTHGIGDLIAASWPAPLITSGTTMFVLLAGLCGAAAVDATLARRTPLCALPSVVVLGASSVLAAPAGAPSSTWMITYLAVLVALLLGAAGTLWDVSPAWCAASLAVVMVSVAVVPVSSPDQRYDPRQSRELPSELVGEVTPLARLDEWRSFEPPVPLFETDAPTSARWRLVGLTRYDGRTWMPAADYRQSSAVLQPPVGTAPTATFRVTIDQLDAAWLPSVDRPVRTDAEVFVDRTVSGLLPMARPSPGQVYSLTVQRSDVSSTALAAVEAAPPDDPFIDGFEVPQPIAELATAMTAGATSDYDRARALAEQLSSGYVLDPTTPPGHSIGNLEVFLERNKRGRDEQFVAAYGLLAASIGLPVRIAVGFQTVPGVDGSGTVAETDGATAWPEVDFGDLGWVRFDPVPTSINTSEPSPGAGPIAPIDVGASPAPTTTTPAPTSSTVPDQENASDREVNATNGPSARLVAISGGLLVLVLALVAVVGRITWIKSTRRRRRRNARSTALRTTGAFDTGVDALIDLGAVAPNSATPLELVGVAQVVARNSAEVLQPLAVEATAAVFAATEPTTGQADHAWQLLEAFEVEVADEVGRLRWWRAHLSGRSVRRHGEGPKPFGSK